MSDQNVVFVPSCYSAAAHKNAVREMNSLGLPLRPELQEVLQGDKYDKTAQTQHFDPT